MMRQGRAACPWGMMTQKRRILSQLLLRPLWALSVPSVCEQVRPRFLNFVTITSFTGVERQIRVDLMVDCSGCLESMPADLLCRARRRLAFSRAELLG